MSSQDDGIRDLLRSLIPKVVPGGCDACDAYQTMDEAHPGVFVSTVHHDDDCPELAHHQQSP
jgi:hypothetical protein